jgi:hypothetical protein
MTSIAENLRSMCGSERRPPELSSQRLPRATPHVGQETEDNCFGVSAFPFILRGCAAIQLGNCSILDSSIKFDKVNLRLILTVGVSRHPLRFSLFPSQPCYLRLDFLRASRLISERSFAFHRNRRGTGNCKRNNLHKMLLGHTLLQLRGYYFLKPASHASRTVRLLGSTVVKAIPIPELGRE